MLQNDDGNAYAKAKAIVMNNNGEPTPAYQAYMRYQEEWNNKKKTYDTAYAAAAANASTFQQWPITGRTYQLEADQAWNKWTALGYKNEIENALNTLASQGSDVILKNV